MARVLQKQVNRAKLSWSQAVDETLCFGWIDSTARSIDEEKFMQFFTKRKATSIWSKINKEKIKRLTVAACKPEMHYRGPEKW